MKRKHWLAMVLCVAAVAAVYTSGALDALIYKYEYMVFRDDRRVRGRTKMSRYDDVPVMVETYYVESGFRCTYIEKGKCFAWDEHGRSQPGEYPWFQTAENQMHGDAPAWVYRDALFKNARKFGSPYFERF